MSHLLKSAAVALCLALLAACGDTGGPGLATGNIQLVVTPATTPFDGDGFTVKVDEAAPLPVPASGQLAFDGLDPGDHTVTLLDVDPPCSTSNNPRTVTVTAGDVTTTTFTITCASIGFIAITTQTTGDDLDPNGYAIEVDGADAPLIGTNATLTVAVDPGDHSVTLSDIADNCTVQGGEPTQTVTVKSDETATADFVLTCTAVP